MDKTTGLTENNKPAESFVNTATTPQTLQSPKRSAERNLTKQK